MVELMHAHNIHVMHHLNIRNKHIILLYGYILYIYIRDTDHLCSSPRYPLSLHSTCIHSAFCDLTCARIRCLRYCRMKQIVKYSTPSLPSSSVCELHVPLLRARGLCRLECKLVEYAPYYLWWILFTFGFSRFDVTVSNVYNGTARKKYLRFIAAFVPSLRPTRASLQSHTL